MLNLDKMNSKSWLTFGTMGLAVGSAFVMPLALLYLVRQFGDYLSTWIKIILLVFGMIGVIVATPFSVILVRFIQRQKKRFSLLDGSADGVKPAKGKPNGM
jgi:hypothetical protein